MIEDVGVAAEAITTDDGAPLHEIESLCMRCGENVINHLPLASSLLNAHHFELAEMKWPRIESTSY